MRGQQSAAAPPPDQHLPRQSRGPSHSAKVSWLIAAALVAAIFATGCGSSSSSGERNTEMAKSVEASALPFEGPWELTFPKP